MFLPIVLLLASQPITVDTTPDPIDAGKIKVQWVVKQLPAWKADILAQYEQPELLQVQTDVDACIAAPTEDDFLHDVDQLTDDWNALVILDKQLKVTDVI
jgi:hypothetical protein